MARNERGPKQLSSHENVSRAATARARTPAPDTTPSGLLRSPLSDLHQMLAQSIHHFFTLVVVHFLLQFLERKVDHIVMVNFFRRNIIAELKPDSVQQINFLGREVWCVWAEIENVLAATGRVNHQRELRLGVC